MTEFPGSFPDECFLLVNRITPFQEGVFVKVRLPEEVKFFRPFHEQGNDISLRFPLKNTIVFKSRIAEYRKLVGTPPPFINKPPFIPPEGKALIIRGDKTETPAIPPGKPPRWDIPPQVYYQGKIIARL
jgi:hypothetical protein